MREIYPLEDAISKFGTALEIKLDYTRPDALEKAKEIAGAMAASPGKLKWRLSLKCADGARLAAEAEDGIAPTEEMFLALEKCVPAKDYRLAVTKEVYLQPQESKWER